MFDLKVVCDFQNTEQFRTLILAELEQMDWTFNDESKLRLMKIAAIAKGTLEAHYGVKNVD